MNEKVDTLILQLITLEQFLVISEMHRMGMLPDEDYKETLDLYYSALKKKLEMIAKDLNMEVNHMRHEEED